MTCWSFPRATSSLATNLLDQILSHLRAAWHYRWPELQATAARLGITPENAVYRAHDGHWPATENRLHIQTTLADVIREAATR